MDLFQIERVYIPKGSPTPNLTPIAKAVNPWGLRALMGPSMGIRLLFNELAGGGHGLG